MVRQRISLGGRDIFLRHDSEVKLVPAAITFNPISRSDIYFVKSGFVSAKTGLL